ncbi:hypothetical protein H0H92_013553 [Tricholoma furcatifolium]|nr:hypothetical protein H0H92_013553 [Tricholoma furcatifolium]
MATFKSPLIGYENAEPLPTTINPDGKSLFNPPTNVKSSAYEEFPEPIDSSNNGFDFHRTPRADPGNIVYYQQDDQSEMQYARELHERIRREFPEVQRSIPPPSKHSSSQPVSIAATHI